MSRHRKRTCLEQGLSLNINWLARTRIIEFGGLTINRSIGWSVSSGDVAVGIISAFLIGHTGWVTIEIEGQKQSIDVISEGRHFGGFQHYFVCPTTGRKASVLWRPPRSRRISESAGVGKKGRIYHSNRFVDRPRPSRQRKNKKHPSQRQKSRGLGSAAQA